jgi:hypothetical protein
MFTESILLIRQNSTEPGGESTQDPVGWPGLRRGTRFNTTLRQTRLFYLERIRRTDCDLSRLTEAQAVKNEHRSN